MQLLIIRHAQSANNALAEGVDYDEYMANRSPEPPITEMGERQAQLVETLHNMRAVREDGTKRAVR